MQRRTASAIFITLLFALLPLASAEWGGRGFYEPDTERDRKDNLMWQGPDTTAGGAGQVHFSTYSTIYPTPVNPNTVAARSAIMNYPSDVHAILGVWKDCNKDGYIGLAEGALADYRAELLLDTSVCPATPGDPFAPGFVPVHNDGGWVRELLVIGPDFFGSGQEPSEANNTWPWNIADESARVWVDFDLPESTAPSTCLSLPGSRGNLQSTGGFLRWADCIGQWRITGTVNLVANVTGLQQLSFTKDENGNDVPRERPDKSASLLNQPNPWGQESDASYATAFDCSRPIVHHDETGLTRQKINDPTGGELRAIFGADDAIHVNVTDEDYNIHLSGTPTVPSVNPSGSAAGTVNETTEATFAGDLLANNGGSCDRTDDNGGTSSGQVYELIESDQEANPISARVQTNFWFEYYEPAPRSCTVLQDAALFSCSGVVCENEHVALGCTPQYAGAWPNTGPYGGLVSITQAGVWRGLPGVVVSRNPYVSRETLQPWGAVYTTGYAHVSREIFGGALPSPVDNTYGAGHCDGTTPITGVFECDPAKWYLNANGRDTARLFHVRVGQLYNLRDIDCYDQAASNTFADGVDMGTIGSNQCWR